MPKFSSASQMKLFSYQLPLHIWLPLVDVIVSATQDKSETKCKAFPSKAALPLPSFPCLPVFAPMPTGGECRSHCVSCPAPSTQSSRVGDFSSTELLAPVSAPWCPPATANYPQTMPPWPHACFAPAASFLLCSVLAMALPRPLLIFLPHSVFHLLSLNQNLPWLPIFYCISSKLLWLIFMVLHTLIL